MKLFNPALLSLLVAAGSAWGQPAPLRLLSSNGVRAAVQALQPQAERASGSTFAAEFSTTTSLKQRIADGEPFDVTILTTEAIDDLVHQGKVVAASRTPLARVGIGLGMRAGVPKPDISTPDAIKRVLLNAKSITYTKGGASQPDIDKTFARLGIADELKPKIMLEPPGQSTTSVAKGKAEIVMTLESEILPIQGIQLVGPLPKEFQHYSVFEGAVNTGAKNAAGAMALLKFLASPEAAGVFKAKGMQP